MSKDILPEGYHTFLQDIKAQVQQAQLQAVVAVNRELIILYWRIGRAILQRQEKEGWGAGVIKRLSDDLHAGFPEMKGFSPRNLGYMKAFAKTNPDETILQEVLAKLSWYHHITLLEKVKEQPERLWYLEQSIEHGWSRNVLVMQIESGLYHRKGKAITNFKQTLPDITSDLANDLLRDPYVFDFITTHEEAKERNIQSALLSHIQRFLLELGVGFTFVGSNFHIVVGEEDFYIDLLFYHIRLRCFVVIELKRGDFKPEYAGKMNFYLTAIDRQVKQENDNPSIGIILCKGKNTVTVEYALSDIRKPVGVATYQLTKYLPDSLKNQLPGIAELEESLQEIPEENTETEE